MNAPTVTVKLTGQDGRDRRLSVSGNPQNVMVVVGGQPFIYPVQGFRHAVDDCSRARGALVGVVYPGTVSSGATVTFPPVANLTNAAVGGAGAAIMEIRRQNRLFQVAIWANSAFNRDQIAKAIVPVLALSFFITLPDMTAARLIYHSSPQNDRLQKQLVYRRDLLYDIEYATTQSEVETSVLVEQINIVPLVAGIDPPGVDTLFVTGLPPFIAPPSPILDNFGNQILDSAGNYIGSSP